MEYKKICSSNTYLNETDNLMLSNNCFFFFWFFFLFLYCIVFIQNFYVSNADTGTRYLGWQNWPLGYKFWLLLLSLRVSLKISSDKDSDNLAGTGRFMTKMYLNALLKWLLSYRNGFEKEKYKQITCFFGISWTAKVIDLGKS